LYWKFAEIIGDDQLDALATIKSKEELIEKSLDYFNHQQRVISAFKTVGGEEGIITKLKFCINNAHNK
jgi:hypothetical protein